MASTMVPCTSHQGSFEDACFPLGLCSKCFPRRFQAEERPCCPQARLPLVIPRRAEATRCSPPLPCVLSCQPPEVRQCLAADGCVFMMTENLSVFPTPPLAVCTNWTDGLSFYCRVLCTLDGSLGLDVRSAHTFPIWRAVVSLS